MRVLRLRAEDSGSEPFWKELHRDLEGLGLSGVQLVISDAHAGLIRAIEVSLQRASWQRRRVHFMRAILARFPKVALQMVAAIVRTILVPRGKRDLVLAIASVFHSLTALSHCQPSGMLPVAMKP